MHTWIWTYTFIVMGSLLAVFLLAGCALLLRRPGPRRIAHSPRSIVTPYGYIPMWDIRTQKMFAEGVRRARKRQYYNPRGG